jgi:hypothetical protein
LFPEANAGITEDLHFGVVLCDVDPSEIGKIATQAVKIESKAPE